MAHEKFQKATQDEILREQAIAREKFQRDMLSLKNRAADAEQRAADATRNAELADARLMAAASKLRDKGFSDREIAEMLDVPVNDTTDE